MNFVYPGSKAKDPALRDVSFRITPSQQVVIVGENGSGKSSLVKLLTRLYEPSSGTVYIDGKPSTEFKRYDLRESTAIFSQNHHFFGGLSLAHDVGLGRWQELGRKDLVDKCLRLGGAEILVGKLRRGTDTILEPVDTKDGYNMESDAHLRGYLNLLKKSTRVSGGEKQRLVAYVYFLAAGLGNH
jgi:ABC-type multidrug transport system fused ATPase/permease subunit